MLARLKGWARGLKRDVAALWLAARDARVPVAAKIVAAAVAAYALSPIDLIPDFVPVLGLLDDLLIVPLGIALAVRMVPREVMAELRAKAVELRAPRSRVGMAMVVGLWAIGLALLAWWVWPEPAR